MPAAALSGAEGPTTLHVLLGRGKHDFPGEAPLLERLLYGGADVNRAVDGFGTPLHTAARQFAFTDAAFALFYDVLFARPDLGCVSKSRLGRGTWHARWLRRRSSAQPAALSSLPLAIARTRPPRPPAYGRTTLL